MFKKIFNKSIKATPKEVGKFYDGATKAFVATHGNVIQSLRTFNVNDYLDYTFKSALIKDNQVILDAGCGVGGPSIYFASKVNSEFHGITISSVQSDMASENAKLSGLENRVKFQKADYHDMVSIFGMEYFDRVIFLESFGHSDKKEELLQSCWEVLKPGGILYIKDLFEREVDDPFEKKRIKEAIHTINTAYKFNVGDLHPVISKIRRLNFILEFIKLPEIDYSQLDAFKVSSYFQEITQIGLDTSKPDWVFPVDYLEIRCRKPHFDPHQNRDIYYLNR